MKTIKNKQLASILVLLLTILFTGCNKNDDVIYSDVVGIYEGTLTTDVAGKSINSKSNSTATAIVTMVGDEIEVHCFNDDFDTTIMLNLYEDGDMLNTCLTGTDFENMYGHMMGQGNMNGNMQNMSSEWMQHLNNEHQNSGEHFGGFNMINTCLTGTDFENMYGHMMGQFNMNGNMQNMSSEWMQHLNNEHQDTDEHFGGFNMKNHSFDYTFKMETGNFHFQGTKQTKK